MTAQSNTETFSTLIKKQLAIFGPDITLSQLEHISGLEFDSDGIITKLPNDPEIGKKLVDLWNQLSPFLAKKIAEPFFNN